MQATHRELILGGQKSGKSRTAESRANDWLTQTEHRAVLLATAQSGDAAMATRIARHRNDRAMRAPGLATIECAGNLAKAIRDTSQADTLLVIDCLTLWLTQQLMPLSGEPACDIDQQSEDFLHAVQTSAGPVVVVSNEISFGVIPLGEQTRAFVDALGLLHQQLAQRCSHVTLMVAGCELDVKRQS